MFCMGEINVVIETDTPEEAKEQIEALAKEFREILANRGVKGHVVPIGWVNEDALEEEIG